MMPRLFVIDRVQSAPRKSTAPREIRPEVVSAPQVPSLCSQYIIGLLGICLVFVPVLEALGTYINLGLPLRIGGIFAVALAVATVVQIKEWVMYAQVALGLGLFGLGCFGPTDAIVDILFCCIFGFLITFLAAVQAENLSQAQHAKAIWSGASIHRWADTGRNWSFADVKKHVAPRRAQKKDPQMLGLNDAARCQRSGLLHAAIALRDEGTIPPGVDAPAAYASSWGGFTNAEKDISFDEVYRTGTMKVSEGETVDR